MRNMTGFVLSLLIPVLFIHTLKMPFICGQWLVAENHLSTFNDWIADHFIFFPMLIYPRFSLPFISFVLPIVFPYIYVMLINVSKIHLYKAGRLFLLLPVFQISCWIFFLIAKNSDVRSGFYSIGAKLFFEMILCFLPFYVTREKMCK